MLSSRTLAVMVAAPCLFAVGCGPVDVAQEDGDLAQAELGLLEGSAGGNGNDPEYAWPHNQDIVDLAQGAFTAAAIEGSPLFYDDDPQGITLLRKVAACALNNGQSVTATNQKLQVSYTFEGRHGLAASWTTSALAPLSPSPATVSKQRWVSACLLALLNFEGWEVPVMLTGQHPRLQHAPTPENADFQMVDGTFWGNLFAQNIGGSIPAFACVSDDFWDSCGTLSNELMTSRVCDDVPGACQVTVLGRCSGTELIPAPCRDSDPETYWGPWNCDGGTGNYLEAITVVLKNDDFDFNMSMCVQ